MSNNVKKPSAVKEFFRKQIVTLKRNPQNIPMAMLLISFVYYSLNLTNMSNTTAKIQGVGMGLCQFCIMLFSLLSIVCMLNAFPSRKKPVYPMVALMFVMFGIMIYADIHFCNGIMFYFVVFPYTNCFHNNICLFEFFSMISFYAKHSICK